MSRIVFETSEENKKKIKIVCAERNLSMKQFIEELIKKELKKKKEN